MCSYLAPLVFRLIVEAFRTPAPPRAIRYSFTIGSGCIQKEHTNTLVLPLWWANSWGMWLTVVYTTRDAYPDPIVYTCIHFHVEGSIVHCATVVALCSAVHSFPPVSVSHFRASMLALCFLSSFLIHSRQTISHLAVNFDVWFLVRLCVEKFSLERVLADSSSHHPVAWNEIGLCRHIHLSSYIYGGYCA